VSLSATYLPGRIEVLLSAGADKESHTLQMRAVAVDSEREKLIDALNKVQAEIEDHLQQLPLEIAERVRVDFDALILDVRSDLDNPVVLDVARIEDRLMQLDHLNWRLTISSNTPDGLRARVAAVRSEIQAAGGANTLLQQLDEIEKQIPSDEDVPMLELLNRKLSDVVRLMRYNDGRSEVKKEHVEYLTHRLLGKLEKLRGAGLSQQERDLVDACQRKILKESVSAQDFKMTVNVLLRIEQVSVNPLYFEKVEREFNRGLLTTRA
jgi:hypothetical protein